MSGKGDCTSTGKRQGTVATVWPCGEGHGRSSDAGADPGGLAEARSALSMGSRTSEAAVGRIIAHLVKRGVVEPVPTI